MSGKKTESTLQEVIRLISKMSDEQCIVVYEAFKIQLEDETKTPGRMRNARRWAFKQGGKAMTAAEIEKCETTLKPPF